MENGGLGGGGKWGAGSKSLIIMYFSPKKARPKH